MIKSASGNSTCPLPSALCHNRPLFSVLASSSAWTTFWGSNVFQRIAASLFHFSLLVLMTASSTSAASFVSSILLSLELGPLVVRSLNLLEQNPVASVRVPIPRSYTAVLVGALRILTVSNVLSAYALVPASTSLASRIAFWSMVAYFLLDLDQSFRLSIRLFSILTSKKEKRTSRDD